MREDWLPLMYFCFIGAILSIRYGKLNFKIHHVTYFSRIEIGCVTFSEFLIIEIFIVRICDFGYVTLTMYLWLLFFEDCFKNKPPLHESRIAQFQWFGLLRIFLVY